MVLLFPSVKSKFTMLGHYFYSFFFYSFVFLILLLNWVAYVIMTCDVKISVFANNEEDLSVVKFIYGGFQTKFIGTFPQARLAHFV